LDSAHDAGVAPDGTRMAAPFYTIEFDFAPNRAKP
jgi:hypothetical protein